MKATLLGGDDYYTPTEDHMRVIAARNRCPQPGDTLHIGDVVALGIEPGSPVGRVVGYLKQGTGHNVAVREYRDGDGWFSTGAVRIGAVGMAWVPWTLAGDYLDGAA